MSRSLRRHRAAVARVRKTHILLQHMALEYLRRPWRGYHRLCMNEPGHWTHEMTIQPARIRSQQLAQLVLRGADPDLFLWPDYKKPHVYYW